MYLMREFPLETYHWLSHSARWFPFVAAFKRERWFEAGEAIGKIMIHRTKEAGESPEAPYKFALDMIDGTGDCQEYCETFLGALEDVHRLVTVPAMPCFNDPEFAALVVRRDERNVLAHAMYSRAGRFMVNLRGRRRVRQKDSQESPESIKAKLESILRELY
jgi:hypothetical protein